MLKSSGVFGEHAQRQAAAAVSNAADDLVMRQYLLERRPQEEKEASSDFTSINKGESTHDIHRKREEHLDSDSDLDSDDEALLNDPGLDEIRSQRLRELRVEHEKLSEQQARGLGQYEEVPEDDFLKEVTSNSHLVCAFFHREFERCLIIDKHLARMAPRHRDTRFIKLNAEKARFFVAKLAIRVLPTVVMFQDGVAVDRLVGFEELGGNDEFTTAQFAARLARSGVIVSKSGKRNKKAKRIQSLV